MEVSTVANGLDFGCCGISRIFEWSARGCKGTTWDCFPAPLLGRIRQKLEVYSMSEYLGRSFSSSSSSSDMTIVLLAERELSLEGIDDVELEDVIDYMGD